MVYTPVLDIVLFFNQISENFLTIKDTNKPLLHAKFQTDWFGNMENMSDSKSIFNNGVWCHER